MLGVALPHGVQRVGQGAMAVVGEGEMGGQVGAHDEPAMVCVGAGDTGDQVRGVLSAGANGHIAVGAPVGTPVQNPLAVQVVHHRHDSGVGH